MSGLDSSQYLQQATHLRVSECTGDPQRYNTLVQTPTIIFLGLLDSKSAEDHHNSQFFTTLGAYPYAQFCTKLVGGVNV